MIADTSVSNTRLSRLAGLGLYLALIALPYAATCLLCFRLFGLRGFAEAAGIAIGMAAFMVATTISDVTIGRRWPQWFSHEGAPICFDAALSAREKLAKLKASAGFVNYLATQLVALCILSVAVMLVR